MTDALDLIMDIAPTYGGVCIRIPGANSLTLKLPVKLADDRLIPYSLMLVQHGTALSAKESTPLHLPDSCPQRHINSNGTFCLGYGNEFSREIVTTKAATDWFEILYKYLQTQTRAANRREWPSTSQWAHGDAAIHQLKAMVSSGKISADLKGSFDKGLLTLRQCSSHRREILEVLCGGAVLFRVWERSAKIINAKKPCICKSSGRKRPKRVGRCSDHAEQIVALAFAMRDMERAEAEFWVSYSGRSCCNTCDVCPLK